MDCLNDELLERHLLEPIADVASHLSGCERCRARVETAEAEGRHFRSFVFPKTIDALLQGAGTKPAAGGAGKIELVVSPWGEVVVDGKSRGISPPLRVVERPPGAHTIEIRNSTFPALKQKVQVKPGEAVRIQHRFK